MAVRDGEVVAYLILRRAEISYWGPHAWVDEAGYAFSDGEAVRDLRRSRRRPWRPARGSTWR